MDNKTEREKRLITKLIIFGSLAILFCGAFFYSAWTIHTMRLTAERDALNHDIEKRILTNRIASQNDLIAEKNARIGSLEEQSVYLLALDPLAGLIDDMDIHFLIDEIPRGTPFRNETIQITSSFGESTGFFPRKGHVGTDMIPEHPERADWSIMAYAPGIVVSHGVDNIYGKFVVIEHSENIRTKYAHLEKIYFTGVTGELVDTDTRIGIMGSTGRSTRAHLHFEIQVRVNEDTWVPVDAKPFLNRGK